MTDCNCALCTEAEDDFERDAARIVIEHGWMVQLVGAGTCDCGKPGCGEDDEGPAFAYTIGLWHQARHPELLMSGQSGPLMHRALNAAAGAVLEGERLVPGMTLENVIGRFPVLVDEVSAEGLEQTVLGAHHFHHQVVPAVQLVWPDTRGIWGWQPGASPEIERRQPQAWRVPAERTGAFARDPQWLMPVPPERMVFSCTCVVDEGAPVLLALREADDARGEDWQLLCGGDHDDMKAAVRLLHMSHLVRQVPSLLELHDLELDAVARRPDVWSPWVREPL